MQKKIMMGHGSGGELTHRLIKEIFLKNFDNEILAELKDSAVFDYQQARWAFTTDSYVIKPLFFPGGDVGKLAICGTINDLAVVGAKPLYVSCGLVIEEGLEISLLKKIIGSMKKAAQEAEVKVITGDTKVVEFTGFGGLFINTSGIGVVPQEVKLSIERIRVGDRIIINGTLGDHTIAIISQRKEFDFQTNLPSDCASLYPLIARTMRVSTGIKVMRDVTRGGLATIAHELVSKNNFGVELWEEAIPIKKEVEAITEILGLDPLYLANEGKVLFVVKKEESDKILQTLHGHPLGKEACIIGKIVPTPAGKVYLRTSIGTRRLLDLLSGDQLPRIC